MTRTLLALGLLGAASCTIAAGLDDLTFAGDGAGGNVQSGGGGGEAGAGGNGGAPSTGGGGEMPNFCMDAIDCSTQHGQVPACTRWACVNASCQILDEPEGTACTAGGGNVCDGNGACVECTMDNQCAGSCQANVCVDASCDDGVKSVEESDVDCGGPCGPCDNGDDCISSNDCVSKVCENTTCAPCATHADCPDNSYYCHLNGDLQCHPLKPCFAPCMHDYECVDGDCLGTCF